MSTTQNLPFEQSKWIWAKDNKKNNDWVILRSRVLNIQKMPSQKIICNIGINGHYFMYVNGRQVVFKGGIKKSFNRSYYDSIDISANLKKGVNSIAFHAFYYKDSSRHDDEAGFVFDCPALNLFSCAGDFSVFSNSAFSEPENCQAQDCGNFYYDAQKEIDNLALAVKTEFSSSWFEPVSEFGAYNSKPLDDKRSIAYYDFSDINIVKKLCRDKNNNIYTLRLPKSMYFTPYFKISAPSDVNQVITIYSDQYGKKIEYAAKASVNEFEPLFVLYGENIFFSVPKPVKVLKLGYREIAYSTQKCGGIEFDDKSSNILLQKSETSLKSCMTHTFLNSPQNDNLMQPLFASIEAEAAMLYYDENAKALLKKTAEDIADGLLFSPKNKTHTLFALSETGIFSIYEKYIDNFDFIKNHLQDFSAYVLDNWSLNETGVLPINQGWQFLDTHFNIDYILIENALYYSACKNLKRLNELAGFKSLNESLSQRMEAIEIITRKYWNDDGYSFVKGFYDERANALTVLCGLAAKEHFEALTQLLFCVNTASPFSEWLVIDALCAMGKFNEAKKRANSRYCALINNDSSVLGASFDVDDKHTHGCQAGMSSVFIKRFGGVSILNGGRIINITPNFVAYNDIKLTVPCDSGSVSCRFKRHNELKAEIVIDNNCYCEVNLFIDSDCLNLDKKIENKSFKLNRGKNKFVI